MAGLLNGATGGISHDNVTCYVQATRTLPINDQELQAASGGFLGPIFGSIFTALEEDQKKVVSMREAQNGEHTKCVDGVPSKACRRQAGATNMFFS